MSTSSITPALGREREGGAGLVRVDMHLDRARAADDEERVAELRQLALELLGIDRLALDEEGRAVAVARELLMHGLERESARNRLELGERLAADVRRDPAQELQHAGSARIDHPGLSENVQLIGGRGEGALAVRHELAEGLRHRRIGGRERLRLLRELAGNRQHRPLLRVADGGVARVARSPKRPCDRCGVDRAFIPQCLDRATDELGEDDPRVPSRAHERGAHDVGTRVAFERRDDGAHGLGHVRARVPVRDRVDVQVVDAGPARLESGQRRPRET